MSFISVFQWFSKMMATENNEYVCEKLVIDYTVYAHVAYTQIVLNIGGNKFDIHAELFTS